MAKELKTLTEGIQHLITISDMLESVRRKYNSSELYNAQRTLSTAIAQFKEAKDILTKMHKQLEKIRNENQEEN